MKTLTNLFQRLYLLLFLLLANHLTTAVAQPQILLIPSDTLVQGNDALSFGIYLNNPNAEGGYVSDVFGVRFNIKSSIGFFPGTSLIDVSQSA